MSARPPLRKQGAPVLLQARAGFRAWWLAIALTAAVGRELHWPMTSAWTYPDPWRSRLITPLTEWVLARLAHMYGFTLMPPMPPRVRDVAARASAVRRILRLARTAKPSIAMAPEGMDSPDGRLRPLPEGAGRFIGLLAAAGYILVPVGVYEEGDVFVLRFGDPFLLQTKEPGARDREAGRIVMGKIGELLPEKLTSPPLPHPPFPSP
jgi:hypothetical protein